MYASTTSAENGGNGNSKSVTGPVYMDDDNANAPLVTLYTKEGCTLCDQVEDVLQEIRASHPHSLQRKDITDDQYWWDRYKYDIPILHVNDMYWCKHRLTREQAMEGLTQVAQNTFESNLQDEPNAAAQERPQKR